MPPVKNEPIINLNTLDQLPIAVALFDNQQFYFINKKGAQLFKIPLSKLKNIQEFSVLKFIKKESHKAILANNKKIIKGATPVPMEHPCLDYAGNEIYLEINLNRIKLNNKYVVQATFTEISARKKTEELLNVTKEKFELITNNANDIIGFYTFYPVEKYLYVSPNIERILGYKPEELLKDNNFFNRRVADNKKEFLKIDKEISTLQKKNIVKNYTYVFKTLKKDKEEVWLENSLVPIQNNQGKITFYLNVLRDITEHKQKEIELQQQKIDDQTLLDGSQVAYAIHHQGTIVFSNKELLKLLKLKDKKDINGKFAVDFFSIADRKKAVKRIQEVYKRKRLNEPNHYKLVDSKGNEIEVEIKSNLVKYNNKLSILSAISNISQQRQLEREMLRAEISEQNNKLLQNQIREKQKVEKSLIEKTGQLTAIFESSSHLIWTVNKNNEIQSFNKNFAKVLLRKYGIKLKTGNQIHKLIKTDTKAYINFWYPKYKEAFLGKKLEFERAEEENKIFRKIFINPIYNAAKEVIEVSCIAHDITETKIYEQKLFNQAAKINSIFDSSHHYIWTINSQQQLTSFNKNYFDLISSLYNTQPYIGLVLNRGLLSNNREYNEILKHNYKKAFEGHSVNFEIETIDKNNNKLYLEIFLNPITENNIPVEVSGIAHDVTEKKIAQERMEQSLKEKEVLLKEVHHRVKNNMQVISSILNLQSSYVSDDYALSLLKESQNRIKTMAYIHESIYQNKSFTSVNFSDYIATLANNIIRSYSVSEEKIQLILNLEKINLNLDNSIPTGLIVNELITNAIKHAFPQNNKGFITVNLKSKNNIVYLEVKDDGIGFNSGIDFKNTNSLGLQLVNTLIEQVNGTVEFISQKNVGSSVLITFKM
ncbi:MAG: PAS domain S-box protein [Bacteroidetes bacterium]|nr:PAS domain S-box protein [Bacteroidota bacterium]